ncbi:MAG TPA: PAS domain S-box protein [Gemmatimonadota bacterium]|nr:PAS domain S-box protein [Gemmatimonadota bacterium]
MSDPNLTEGSRRQRPIRARLQALLRGPGWSSRVHEFEDPKSRYRRLFDGVPLALYLSAPDGTIIDANPATVQLLGYPDLESLLQANAFDIFAEPDARSTQVKALDQEELVRGYEMQLRRYDGDLIWVLDYARAVRDDAGDVRFYEGALEDITERKAAREALRETNEKLRAIVEDSPLAIITHDMEGIVWTWNPAAEEIFGWPAAEVLGKRVPFVPTEEWNQFKRLVLRVGKGERLTAIDLRQERSDGATIYTDITAGPLRDRDGNVMGVLGVVADVTQRKKAEETQRRLAEILEGTPDLVGIATVDGQNIYLNPAGRNLLGVNSESAPSPRPIWEYHTPDHAELVRDQALPAAIRDGSWSGEAAFVSHEGTEIPTSMVMIAHRTDDVVDYVSVVARDLTEQKALEERVRQAQTMDAIGRLAGGIAHDFNNLLTTIIGHSDLLLRHLEDGQAREDIQAIKEAGQRAASLTSQLLAFGRRQILQLQLVDLNSVIAESDQRLKEAIGDAIQLVTVLDVNLGKVKADPIHITDVISALVENACEAMSDGGRLTIETADIVLARDTAQQLGIAGPGRYAVLTVADTGLGMDEGTQARIFEPFFSTKTEVKRTGLGLPTVYGIVKQCGGDVWVTSTPGSGTSVKIYLPIAAGEPAAVTPSTPAVTPSQGEGATILLVEDEPSVLSLASRVLRTRGYTVLEAQDGVEAISAQKSHEGHIDLLITDVVMPKIGGPELAKQLQSSQPDLRVIYMSGYSDNAMVTQTMSDKGVPFLQKPFTPSALAGITRHVLAEARQETRTDRI